MDVPNALFSRKAVQQVKTHAIDMGALTPFLWAFEERKKLVELYELSPARPLRWRAWALEMGTTASRSTPAPA